MIHLAAPAKLNLHLRVLGLRTDGYHAIESLFVRLSLCDDVEIDLGTDGIQFVASGDVSVPENADNLCVAAAVSFFEEIDRVPAASIRLTKRIPVAAGLGGGSSDAASVLLGLNKLLGAPLDLAALIRVASRVGSDVPFFLLESPFALVRGRGEDLSPLAPPMSRPLLIIVPDYGVSAGDAYTWRRAGAERDRMIETAALSDWSAIAQMSTNDLAPGVFERHPALSAASDALTGTGAFMSLLCGSGACVAGIYENAAARDAGLELLRADPAILPGWRVVSTWTVGPGAPEVPG